MRHAGAAEGGKGQGGLVRTVFFRGHTCVRLEHRVEITGAAEAAGEGDGFDGIRAGHELQLGMVDSNLLQIGDGRHAGVPGEQAAEILLAEGDVSGDTLQRQRLSLIATHKLLGFGNEPGVDGVGPARAAAGRGKLQQQLRELGFGEQPLSSASAVARSAI